MKNNFKTYTGEGHMHLSQQGKGFTDISCLRKSETLKEKTLFNSNKKLVAFTLAEVLITLAIIGVVAALTIPVVVQKYKKKVVEAKLLKAYTTLNEAFNLSEVENGSMSTWNYQDKSPASYFNKYLVPYLKVSSTNLKATRLSNMGYKNGIKTVESYKTKTLFSSGQSVYNFTLNDGTVFIFRTLVYTACGPSGCETIDESTTYDQEIYVDINGSKEPNFVGRDIFVFSIRVSGNKLRERFTMYQLERLSFYAEMDGQDVLPSYCKWEASYCGTVIQLNGWKVPDDYAFEL